MVYGFPLYVKMYVSVSGRQAHIIKIRFFFLKDILLFNNFWKIFDFLIVFTVWDLWRFSCESSKRELLFNTIQRTGSKKPIRLEMLLVEVTSNWADRITEDLMWEGSFGVLSKLLLKVGPTTAGCPRLCSLGFWIYPRMGTLQHLFKTCSCVWTLSQ